MTRFTLPAVLCVAAGACLFSTQAQADACSVHAVEYKGWKAVQIVNQQEKITIVPQLGGRVMQVEFEGHEYLFVNPRYAGKYISPDEAKGDWINYGGDKIWPMPEGDQDEAHWVLESGALDDGIYDSRTMEEGPRCTVELTGPADPVTGLQYSRQISVSAGSTAIHFHAVMHNATAHTIRWSVQSVSQYNVASSTQADTFNRKFWAYTEANPASSYLDGFHVRSGLADDPSFRVDDSLFRLHWMYLSNEVWIDSPGGWLAIADGESGFGMIERFAYDSTAEYPGKATVIFYKNGPSVSFNDADEPTISDHHQMETPYYMEAEVNSPMATLPPSGSYAMDTTWYPLRTQADIRKVTEAGTVTNKLEASSDGKTLKLAGSFGVVARGHLEVRLYSRGGREIGHETLNVVGPESEIHLERVIAATSKVARVSLHLIDDAGRDVGILDTAALPVAGEEQ